MNIAILLVVGLLGMVMARPNTIIDFEAEDHEHEQSGKAGKEVAGEYKWTSPEGEEFFVKYVADDNGYRVLESNAVPSSSSGVSADGRQGATHSADVEDN